MKKKTITKSSNVKGQEFDDAKSTKRNYRGRNRATVLKDGIKAFTGDKVFAKGPNDPSWRTGNKLSTTLAATLPFNNPTGLVIDANKNGYTTANVRLPGIMRVRVLLTAGQATDFNSPVNLAARNVYSRVRRANSGSKNYEANDIMLYFLAMQQAYGLCGWLQRVYKTICKFSTLDRFTPNALLYAMDVDATDIKKHQAELAWLISWLGGALNSLAVPKHPVFTASYEAFKHVYTDDSSPRHQLYMLEPWNFMKYDPVYDSAGGAVVHSGDSIVDDYSGSAVPLYYDEIYTMVHTIMDVLLSDSDIAIISGDILKAFDPAELFKVVAEDTAPIEFEYSEELLQQFHNTRCFPYTYGSFKGYHQVAGSPGKGPYLEGVKVWNTTVNAEVNAMKLYDIDAFGTTPSPEEIVNCTALQTRVGWYPSNATPKKVVITKVTFDLYYVEAVDIFSTPTSDAPDVDISRHCSDLSLISTLSDLDGISLALNFDWCPIAYYYNNIQSAVHPVGDVRMLSFFAFNIHERIHENSVLSLFSLLDN